MHFWLTHVGETLPIDGPVQLFRYGLLAEMLTRRGHDVTRWAPTFVHATKTFRAKHDTTVTLNRNYTIELLHAGGYGRHIGLRRFAFTKRLARAFKTKLAASRLPDIIVAGLPTPEVCDLAVQFGKQHDIPAVVDIRDLWPQIFIDVVPRPFKPVARRALRPLFETTRRTLQQASALYAVSRQYLRWGLTQAGRDGRSADKVHYLGRQRARLSSQARAQAEHFWRSKGITAERGFRCCYFGSMNHSSDLSTVVQAAHLLRSAEPRIDFVVCGEGPKLKSLQKAAADLDNVLFAGWVNQPEVSVLMDWSDVGLAAYAANAPQSIPNKPIEYLSASLPIVSSLQGEFARLLDEYHCGRKYTAGNCGELARVLIDLSDKSGVTGSIRLNADRLFRSHFDADCVYNAMIDDLVELKTTHCRTAA